MTTRRQGEALCPPSSRRGPALLKPGKSFNTWGTSTFFWDYCGGLCFSTARPSSDQFLYIFLYSVQKPATIIPRWVRLAPWLELPLPLLPGWSGCTGCMAGRCVGSFGCPGDMQHCWRCCCTFPVINLTSLLLCLFVADREDLRLRKL